MIEILSFITWSAIIGYWSYSIGYSVQQAKIKKLRHEAKMLRRTNHNLRRWLDQQAKAVTDADLDLELERILNAR